MSDFDLINSYVFIYKIFFKFKISQRTQFSFRRDLLPDLRPQIREAFLFMLVRVCEMKKFPLAVYLCAYLLAYRTSIQSISLHT